MPRKDQRYWLWATGWERAERLYLWRIRLPMVTVIQMARKPESSVKSLSSTDIPHAAGHAQAAPLARAPTTRPAARDRPQKACIEPGPASEKLQQARAPASSRTRRTTMIAGQHEALARSRDGVGAAQGEALLQEDHAHEDAAQEAEQAGHGRQVAAAEAQDHPQGAAQEDQGAHHHEQGPARSARRERSRPGPGIPWRPEPRRGSPAR